MLKYPKPLISLLLMTCFSSYPKSFKQLILFKIKTDIVIGLQFNILTDQEVEVICY